MENISLRTIICVFDILEREIWVTFTSWKVKSNFHLHNDLRLKSGEIKMDIFCTDK